MKCLPSSTNFFLLQQAILIGSSKKKMKKLQLCKFLKIEVSIKDGGPSYTCEMRTILGETYGIKVWCYWKHLEKLFRDLIGSYCSQQKNLFSMLSP
jgi:hypothetical protein